MKFYHIHIVLYNFVQNRYMIAFGIVAFSSCVSYLYYMRKSAAEDGAKTYTALDDQDQLVLRKKRSRWE